MPPAVQVGATLMCPHGGQITVVPTNVRVTAGGPPLAVLADTFLVAGCPFVVGGVPQPCIRVQWLVPAMRLTIGGQPAILQSSTGLCLGPTQAPQGPPNVIVTQPRVQAQ